jgi:hypothetical protein
MHASYWYLYHTGIASWRIDSLPAITSLLFLYIFLRDSCSLICPIIRTSADDNPCMDDKNPYEHCTWTTIFINTIEILTTTCTHEQARTTSAVEIRILTERQAPLKSLWVPHGRQFTILTTSTVGKSNTIENRWNPYKHRTEKYRHFLTYSPEILDEFNVYVFTRDILDEIGHWSVRTCCCLGWFESRHCLYIQNRRRVWRFWIEMGGCAWRQFVFH